MLRVTACPLPDVPSIPTQVRHVTSTVQRPLWQAAVILLQSLPPSVMLRREHSDPFLERFEASSKALLSPSKFLVAEATS